MSPLASPVSSLEPCSSSAVSPRLPRKRVAEIVSEESTVLLPCDQCLFCDKKTIKKRGNKELPTKTFTEWSHKFYWLAEHRKNDYRNAKSWLQLLTSKS